MAQGVLLQELMNEALNKKDYLMVRERFQRPDNYFVQSDLMGEHSH